MKYLLCSMYIYSSILIVISKLIKLEITPIIISLLFLFSLKELNVGSFTKKIIFVGIIINIILLQNINRIEYIYTDLFNIVTNIVLGIIVTSFEYKFFKLKKILRNFSYLNIIIVSIYVFFNYKNIRMSELGYMNIGYYYMFSNLYLIFYWNLKRKKEDLFIIILTIILQLLFGNRFSTIISMVFLLYNFFKKLNKKLLGILLGSGVIILFYSKIILEKLIESFQIKTIGILRMYYTLDNIKEFTKILSGRDEIYLTILKVIKENILGVGIYGYLSHTDYQLGFYPHNIFLEVMLQFGILGIIVLIIFIFYSFYYISKIKLLEKKNFYQLFLFFNINLLVSGSYLKHRFFILFVFLIITPNFIKYRIEEKWE